ncbi:type IV secretory system conjugative DNA transfer family protein [Persephonella sp. KM09-Lau-8]|uniref:type IV secretory system conjugative DNA transfer family protein n=1 Tax=Persephonella sp. KM09-Lau-8 TaxID=1158345 RepID=UPI000498248E|nr:type IV secretory system conjugative DNA transfer family protein [Persephonella sp. KM09-Lau-8]
MAESFSSKRVQSSGNFRPDPSSHNSNVLTTDRIRNVLDLLDYIQRRFAVESRSKVLDDSEDLFTAKDYFNVFSYSFKSVLAEEFLIFAFLLYPIYVLYKAGVITVFGGVEQRWLVAGFMYLFTFIVQLFFVLFVAYLLKNYYQGVSPRKATSAYAWGRISGYLLKIVIIAGSLFSVYYFLLGDPKIVSWLVSKISGFLHIPPEDVYRKIVAVREEVHTDLIKIPAILSFFMLSMVAIVVYQDKHFKKQKAEGIGKNLSHKKQHKKDAVHLGWGYQLYPLNKKLIPIYQGEGIRNQHTAVIGTTGVGKTYVLMNRVEYDIMRGDNVVVIDPKGSGDLLSFVLETAIKAGRLQDFIYVNPFFPEISARISPLAYYAVPDVVINTVIAGIRSKDEFYINIARELVSIVVYGLIELSKSKERGNPTFTFEKIKEWISVEQLNRLKDLLSEVETPTAEKLIMDIEQVLSTPPEYFAKVGSSLRTVLTVLSTGNVGEIIGNAKGNDFMQRILDGKGVILYVETGSMLTRETSNIVGRVILSNIATFAGLYYVQRKKFPRKLKIHADEFYTQMFIGVEHLFDKGREVGISMDVYFQSLSQLEAEVGDKRANIILETINSYMLMRIKSPKTAERFAEIIGIGKTMVTNIGSDGSVSMFERDDWRVEPSEFIRLDDREFILHTGKRDYRGYTVDVKKPYIVVKMPEINVRDNDRGILN